MTENIYRLQKSAEAEEAFIRCLKVMDYEPTTAILNSVYDLLLSGMTANEINKILVTLKHSSKLAGE